MTFGLSRNLFPAHPQSAASRRSSREIDRVSWPLLLIVLTLLLSACKHTPVFRDVRCADGKELLYQNEPVGCIYNADASFGRVDELCPSDQGHTAFESDGFGLEVPESLGGGRIGCLVCIHSDNDAAAAAIMPGGLYPAGFAPGIGCLGYFIFQPVERL